MSVEGDTSEWRDMFGKELKVGYWVAIPRRKGLLGTRPLDAGWYSIEALREDNEHDWEIRFAGDRYQWLLSWDTLPVSDQERCPQYEHGLTERIRAKYAQPGYWLYVPTPVNDWFEVAARLPSFRRATNEIEIPLIGHQPVAFNMEAMVSVRDKNPDGSNILRWSYWE